MKHNSRSPSRKPLIGSKVAAILYWLVVATFVVLEPWGKVDTRNFSYMGSSKFWEYNVYIGFVLVAMLALGWVLWKGRAGLKSLAWIVAINTMFIVMCVFDMLHLFPDPAESMPFWVWVIEITNSLVLFGITLSAPKLIFRKSSERYEK